MSSLMKAAKWANQYSTEGVRANSSYTDNTPACTGPDGFSGDCESCENAGIF